jgi:hypothetical protein
MSHSGHKEHKEALCDRYVTETVTSSVTMAVSMGVTIILIALQSLTLI